MYFLIKIILCGILLLILIPDSECTWNATGNRSILVETDREIVRIHKETGILPHTQMPMIRPHFDSIDYQPSGITCDFYTAQHRVYCTRDFQCCTKRCNQIFGWCTRYYHRVPPPPPPPPAPCREWTEPCRDDSECCSQTCYKRYLYGVCTYCKKADCYRPGLVTIRGKFPTVIKVGPV